MKNKIKVLIADNIEIVAKTNKNIVLKNENVEVVGIASNGKEEFDMILNLKPDLAITDNKMPEMNGVEVIEKIKNLDIENKPDFILVTGDSGIELINKCKELNIFKILNKLSLEQELTYSIEEYINFKDYENKETQKNINQSNTTDKLSEGIFKRLLSKVRKGNKE